MRMIIRASKRTIPPITSHVLELFQLIEYPSTKDLFVILIGTFL
jgi:hypothetical protein